MSVQLVMVERAHEDAAPDVGLDSGEPAQRVGLGGEGAGCGDPLTGRVEVPGLPPTRRELAYGS